MECKSRARAREVHGHGKVLLTLLKFSQVPAGSRAAYPATPATSACALLLAG